jgi:hypothetical protein
MLGKSMLVLLEVGLGVELKPVLLVVKVVSWGVVVGMPALLRLLRLMLVADKRWSSRLGVVLLQRPSSVIDSMAVLTDARRLRVGLWASVGVEVVEVKELLNGCGNHN